MRMVQRKCMTMVKRAQFHPKSLNYIHLGFWNFQVKDEMMSKVHDNQQPYELEIQISVVASNYIPTQHWYFFLIGEG